MALRKQVRLLVVDDQPEFFELLCTHAEMYNPNYRIECFSLSTAEEALTLLDEAQISVILLDAHVSGNGGVDLVRRLTIHGAPVVVTSTTASVEISESAMASGAASYVSKSDNPDDVDALLELVASLAESVGPGH